MGEESSLLDKAISKMKQNIPNLSRENSGVYKIDAIVLAENFIQNQKIPDGRNKCDKFEAAKIKVLRNMLVHGSNFNLNKTTEQFNDDYNIKKSLENFYKLLGNTKEIEKVYLLNSILFKNRNYLSPNGTDENDLCYIPDESLVEEFFEEMNKRKITDLYCFREKCRERLENNNISLMNRLPSLENKQDIDITSTENNIDPTTLKEQDYIEIANEFCHLSAGTDVIDNLESNIENIKINFKKPKLDMLDKLLQSQNDINSYFEEQQANNKKSKR